MQKSESIKELSTALAKAQSDICNPKKTSANPFFKSKYSDLAEVINVSKHVLAENGLSIIQMPSLENGCVSVESMIIHSSGEFITSTMSMPATKNDPQSIGSLISYIRRYSWASICSLAQEDDDGNAASGNNTNPAQAANKQPTITINDCKSQILNAGTLQALKAAWDKVPKEWQETLLSDKNARKIELTTPKAA